MLPGYHIANMQLAWAGASESGSQTKMGST